MRQKPTRGSLFYLISNLQLRHALLKLLDTRIRDLCAGQIQISQFSHTLEMLYARIRDLGAVQV